MPQVLHDQAQSPDDRYTLSFLRRRNIPCPACGYNLNALTAARCPECGRTLFLRVSATAQQPRAWLTALIATSVIAAVGLWSLAMELGYHLLQRWYPPPLGSLFIQLRWTYIVGVPAALLMLFIPRLFARLPGALQWIISLILLFACCCTLTICVLRICLG